MGLSSNAPEGAVTEEQNTPRASRSPSLTDAQPDVVKVDDSKQDAERKAATEKPASMSDYLVCFHTPVGNS